MSSPGVSSRPGSGSWRRGRFCRPAVAVGTGPIESLCLCVLLALIAVVCVWAASRCLAWGARNGRKGDSRECGGWAGRQRPGLVLRAAAGPRPFWCIPPLPLWCCTPYSLAPPHSARRGAHPRSASRPIRGRGHPGVTPAATFLLERPTAVAVAAVVGGTRRFSRSLLGEASGGGVTGGGGRTRWGGRAWCRRPPAVWPCPRWCSTAVVAVGRRRVRGRGPRCRAAGRLSTTGRPVGCLGSGRPAGTTSQRGGAARSAKRSSSATFRTSATARYVRGGGGNGVGGVQFGVMVHGRTALVLGRVT